MHAHCAPTLANQCPFQGEEHQSPPSQEDPGCEPSNEVNPPEGITCAPVVNPLPHNDSHSFPGSGGGQEDLNPALNDDTPYFQEGNGAGADPNPGHVPGETENVHYVGTGAQKRRPISDEEYELAAARGEYLDLDSTSDLDKSEGKEEEISDEDQDKTDPVASVYEV